MILPSFGRCPHTPFLLSEPSQLAIALAESIGPTRDAPWVSTASMHLVTMIGTGWPSSCTCSVKSRPNNEGPVTVTGGARFGESAGYS